MNSENSKLKRKKHKNTEQRREFVRYWANYVRENPDRKWSRQQNVVINSQIQSAESSSSSRHRRAFEEFAELAREELGDSLKKLVLYGSVARGEETEESDVDVFAVVSDGEARDTLYDLAAEAGRSYGVHLAAVVRTEEEFEKTRDSFFTREVMDSGTAVV